MTIEPVAKKYIDETVKIVVDYAVPLAVEKATIKAAAAFENVMRHEIGLLQEFWRHEFALAMEIIKDKPGREEVREIAQEELSYHGLHR